MREEYELEVLEKYDIEVKSTRRIRGAFFCIGSELKSGRVGDFGDCLQSRSVPFGAAGDYDTKERPMLLKETKLSERRALFLYDALSEIERCGNVKVDTPVFTKEGELRAASREGAFYMLKKWYQGRECDVRQEQDVVRAAAKLAVLHKDMEKLAVKIRPGADAQGKNPVEEVRRYNRELKRSVHLFVPDLLKMILKFCFWKILKKCTVRRTIFSPGWKLPAAESFLKRAYQKGASYTEIIIIII